MMRSGAPQKILRIGDGYQSPRVREAGDRVVDHIHEHLAEALSLETLARVAAFSPFLFHRVFRAITGETLFTFIQRLRLEEHRQAAFLIAGIELTRGAIASSSRG
jgi:AraC-like DNA-binding protein